MCFSTHTFSHSPSWSYGAIIAPGAHFSHFERMKGLDRGCLRCAWFKEAKQSECVCHCHHWTIWARRIYRARVGRFDQCGSTENRLLFPWRQVFNRVQWLCIFRRRVDNTFVLECIQNSKTESGLIWFYRFKLSSPGYSCMWADNLVL